MVALALEAEEGRDAAQQPQPKKFSWSPLPRRRKRTNIASPTVAALSPAKVVQLVRDRRTGFDEGEFRDKCGCGWDACVCFTVVDGSLTEQQESVISRLESGGIETKLVDSSDGKRRWALLRAPVHRLARAADAGLGRAHERGESQGGH